MIIMIKNHTKYNLNKFELIFISFDLFLIYFFGENYHATEKKVLNKFDYIG